jgi:hypothetical protein
LFRWDKRGEGPGCLHRPCYRKGGSSLPRTSVGCRELYPAGRGPALPGVSPPGRAVSTGCSSRAHALPGGGLRVRTHSVRAPGRFPRLRRDRACGQQGSSSESGSLCTCGGALVPSGPSWSSHPDPCVKPHRERSVGAASSPRAAIGAARLPDFRQAGQCLKTWQARDEAWRFWGCKLAYTRIGCSGSTRDGVVPLLWADASREDRGV